MGGIGKPGWKVGLTVRGVGTDCLSEGTVDEPSKRGHIMFFFFVWRGENNNLRLSSLALQSLQAASESL
jgi:hypothetical protein